MADLNNLSRYATICTVVLLVVLGGLAAVFAHRLTKPLVGIVEIFRDMAHGDLTRTIAVQSRDEVGQLAEAADAMVRNLRQMFGNIVANTNVLAGSSTELSSIATQLSGGAKDTTRQSATVAAATEQMSANMTTMAASTEQMSGNVRTVASAVEELTASISEVARSAEQSAAVANSAAELATAGNAKINELGAAAGEIGKVIEVIQDIAEQTNLLALNATIEAARAGDAGKGFAVVATEVKELAKQTAAATEDIRQRIEGIQNSTGQVVQSIGEIGATIKKVNEVARTIAAAVEEQSITTKEIGRNVAQTSVAAETVARGVAESASVTREIARNIAEVDQSAKQTAEGATAAQTAGGKVTQVVDKLSALMGQFKVSNKRFDAEPIKTAHALWSAKLSDLLAGKINLDPSEVARHTDCKFGKWYYGPQGKQLAGLDIFNSVGEQHAKFHELAKSIAELYKDGRTQEAAQKFAETRALTQNLFRLLDQLDEKANREQTAPKGMITQSAGGKMTRGAGELQSLVGQFKTSA
jgi:methyl-accepting chemotaxis protein